MPDPAASLDTKALQRMSSYRWVVLAIAFYFMNFAYRTNIGVVVPLVTKEFGLTNLQAGSLMSFFFLGMPSHRFRRACS